MLPDYSRLYRVGEGWQRQPVRFTTERDERCNTPTAYHWTRALFRGEQAAVPPLRLKVFMGGLVTDWMWSASVAIIVISQRLVDTLIAARLTGWSTYAVDCTDRSGQKLGDEQYYGLAITGRAGVQNLARSAIVDKPPIVPGGAPYQVLRGLFFQNDVWDGSDFCVVDDTMTKVVTERVVDVFRKHKIRHVVFTPLNDYEQKTDALITMGLWPPATPDAK